MPKRQYSRFFVRLLPAVLCALLAMPVHAVDEDDDDGTDTEVQSELNAEAPAELAVEVSSAKLPTQELSPKILYEFLLAEIAGSQGNLALASAEYLNLAQTTHDPRIARRAAEIAFYSRQFDQALLAARIWVETDPDSSAARQMLIGLLVAFGKTDEVTGHLTRIMAQVETKNQGEELLRLSRIFDQAADKQAVRLVLNQVTEPYLKLPEAHVVRAQAARQAGDAAAAMTEIDLALAQRPEWENAVLFKALLLQPDPPKMLEVLRQYVDNYPMQAKDARVVYARALVTEKRYDDALKQFRIALEYYPDRSDILYAVGLLSLQSAENRPLAEKSFKRLIEQGHAESNTLRSYLGQIAEDDKRWQEAITWYEGVGSGDQFAPSQLRAARILVKLGQIDAARAHLHKAAEADASERSALIVAEAQLLREAKRNEESYAVLEAGLQASPDAPELLYESALAAEKLDKLEVMERNLRHLIKLQPDYAQAYNALGYSFAERNIRLEEAAQLIDKALKLTPEDPFILDSKGWVLFRLGDNAGALDVLNRAFAKRPDPEIAAHIGEVLWALDRRDEAKRLWSEALKQSPDNQALRDVIKKFNP